MSIFRNTKRIVDHTVQKTLIPESPRQAFKGRPMLKQEKTNKDHLIIEEVGYKRYSVVKKNISPQRVAKPQIFNILSNNHVTPKIYYEVSNKNKTLSQKTVEEVYYINGGENSDKQNQLQKNKLKGVPKRYTAVDIPKPIAYDMFSQHISQHISPNKGVLCQALKASRNRVFDVFGVQRQAARLLENATWFAKRREESKGVSGSGRIGKLSSANESGFFFKTDRERLLELKKNLKDKEKGPDAPKKS